MDAGHLVPDTLIMSLVKYRIGRPDCANGFLFDGFPRTVAQTEAMEEAGVALDYVVELDVDDAELVERLAGRRVHPASGRSYHIRLQPPQVPDKDDVTGEGLVEREEDREEAVRKRLQIYRAETQQLSDYYSAWAGSDDPRAPKYRKVSGSGSVEAVRDRILAALGA